MNTFKSRLIAAGLLLLLVNAVVFAGVAWNRSGTPESQLTLSDRELQSPWRSQNDEENSGIALTLKWSALESEAELYGNNNPAWLDKAKLQSLGFTDLQPRDSRSYRRENPREALVVLELAGPAYQAAVQQAKDQLARLRAKPAKADVLADWKKHLSNLQDKRTRLYAVDAGLELEALRQRYPNRQQYAIVPALISSNSWQRNDSSYFHGRIDDLPVKQINLPSELRAPFEGLTGTSWEAIDFQVEVAFGQRLEPWIVSAQVTPIPVENHR